MRGQHKIHNIKPSEKMSSKAPTSPATSTTDQNFKFRMSSTDFQGFFYSAFTQALFGIINCPVRNSSVSANGQQVIIIAKDIKDKQSIMQQLKYVLQDRHKP